MTTRAACANSAWLTATTWATVDATSFSNSESANTALTTSYVESSTFTPGVITVDGLAVKIASRTASPTGTMSVHLAIAGVEVTGSAVTVNVSDVPTATATTGTTTPVGTAEGGWMFFLFAAPLTLIAATAYSVGAKTSSASQVNLWSTATSNWSRYLRTTTTGNMAGGDDAIITGEWTAAATVTARTVTMDETATTDYGSNTTSQVTPALAICKGGTLTCGTAAATNYVLRLSGYCIVYNGGTMLYGAPGAEIPIGSTAVLEFDCASDGDFGRVNRNGCTTRGKGLPRTSGKNVSMCKLNADAAGGATSITLDTDTGWLSGDLVCLAPTSQTATQFESKALTGNATATTAAIAALTNAHSGTSPTQGEVGLLTRNVIFRAVTAGVVTFDYVGQTATYDMSWVWFRYLSQNAGGKRGLEIATTTGSFTMDYCSIHDSDAAFIFVLGAASNNITITNTVMYNWGIASGSANGFNISAATSGTWTASNNMICGTAAASAGNVMVTLNDVGGTFTNNSISGAASAVGLSLLETNAALGTFSGLSVHTNGTSGIALPTGLTGTIATSQIWRHPQSGITPGAANVNGIPLVFSSCDLFGNGSQNINLPTSSVNLVFASCTSNGDTTFATTSGISATNNGGGLVRLFSCSFSVVSGIKTKCSGDINYGGSGGAGLQVISDNCILNGTGIITGFSGIQNFGQPILQAQNFGQVANDNRTYYPNGTGTFSVIQSNSTTVYSPNVLSEQMTPASASVKLSSQSIFVECVSGKAATPIVQVQKNGTYNGNAPRLIVRRQDSIGITADTVLDTLTVGANTWEALTGTTVVATQNGVFEFVIDCDGTAGSVFVGDATATTA